MKKIIAICVLGLLFGCQSTIQDLNTKYLKSNNQTQAKKTVEKPKSLKHKLFINVTPSDANIYLRTSSRNSNKALNYQTETTK